MEGATGKIRSKMLQGGPGDLGLLLSSVQVQLELIFISSPEFYRTLCGEAPGHLLVSEYPWR